ncbi:hypothetical protein CDAR_290631, partial [Caerostris darwini]
GPLKKDKEKEDLVPKKRAGQTFVKGAPKKETEAAA